MLKHRIISGCLIVAGLVLAVSYLPSYGVWLVLVAVSSLAQLEFYAIINMPGIPVFRVVGLLCGASLISATFFALGAETENSLVAYKWEHLVLLGSLIAVFVRQFPQKYNDKPLATIACTLLGVWYVPFLFNFFTHLAFARTGGGFVGRIDQTGRLLVLYLVLVVKSADIGAYFVGRMLGRHRLLPRISPAKTWEGLAGGFGSAVLASWVFFCFTGGRFGKVVMGLGDAVVLGCLLSAVGVVGDMFESLVKRASGAKDSGSMVPGMGGILDVVDSLLFGAPVLYVYVWLLLS